MSLSSYLRELIHDDTARPTMDEALERISMRDSIEVHSSHIHSFITDDRR